MIRLRCLIHGHEIIRYDREYAWQCMCCLKQWPMSPELTRPRSCPPSHSPSTLNRLQASSASQRELHSWLVKWRRRLSLAIAQVLAGRF
jgi:hypothetical protein